MDFNPITPAKSGNIKEYLAALEQQAEQETIPAKENEILRVVPVGRFERYIEPAEITQDQYIIKAVFCFRPVLLTRIFMSPPTVP